MVDNEVSLIGRTPETFREKQQIIAHVLHEVLEIDVRGQRVRVRDLKDGKEWWDPYDQLMVATGAIPIQPRVPGIDATGVLGIHTLQTGIDARTMIDREGPRRAIVVGGGYIGIEMAEAMILRGIEVSMVEKMPQVMGTLDSDMGALVAAALRGAGVALYLEESLEGFDTHDGRVRAVITDKRTLAADIVVLGMGVRPNSDLAKEAGLPLGVKGSIKVNDRMQTSVDHIWAAGDCVESVHLVSREPFWVALGTVANKQGRVAGINIGGGTARFPGVVGTAITKFFEWEIARTGLHEREAQALGLEYVVGTIDSLTRAEYYPEAGAITVRLLAQKGTGRLLGGQIVGSHGAGKRIDVLAMALHAGMTVGDMINLDLSYAPPFSPVWDPVIIAARETAKMV